MGEHAKEGVTAIVKYVAHWEKEVRTAGKSILVHCMRSQKSVLEHCIHSQKVVSTLCIRSQKVCYTLCTQ